MAKKQRFASVDDHVVEPPDLWSQRLSKAQWGDRIPHIEVAADGSEHWVVDGRRTPLGSVIDSGATLASGASRPQHWSDVAASASDPNARLQAMDADGVDVSVLYPTLSGLAAETFGRIADPALELACVRAYNDWLIEEWAAASPRLVPQCIVPVASVESAVNEIRRAVGRGHKGVVFPPIPQLLRPDSPHINDPQYDPLWHALEDLAVPLCMHASESEELQMEPYEGYSPAVAGAYRAITRPTTLSTIVGNMNMSRALRTFPKLKVIYAESGLGWIVFALELADHQFERMGLNQRGYDLLPSEVFKRQGFVTGWYDRDSLHHARAHVGAGNILWSTNFPLATSTWPNSRDSIARCFDGIAAADREQMLWGNAASLYRL